MPTRDCLGFVLTGIVRIQGLHLGEKATTANLQRNLDNVKDAVVLS